MRCLRLRSGPLRGLHQQDRQRQAPGEARLEHQPEQQRSRFRYNYLDARRDLPPHPFVLSFNNTGRGPNASSLPFQNSGYAINNHLNSFALELNSRSSGFANRFFASYNRFRDHRTPFSEDFPTIEIGEAASRTPPPATSRSRSTTSSTRTSGSSPTTSPSSGAATRSRLGANFETFSFFNSFNIFRNGVFFLPGAADQHRHSRSPRWTSSSPRPIRATPTRSTSAAFIGTGPFKGEDIAVGQLGLYAQDEFLVSDRLNLTAGVRVDFPMYFTDPVDNPFSRGLTALDENRQPETVDQSSLPGRKPLFSPRVGFNWNAVGDRQHAAARRHRHLHRPHAVRVGRQRDLQPGRESQPARRVQSDPGYGVTSEDAILAQSFDVNAHGSRLQVAAVLDHRPRHRPAAGRGFLATLEFMYGKDINNVFMRNADLVAPVRTLPDGRPYYGGAGANNELNPDGGAGIYVIDNTDEGYSFNVTAQLRKALGLRALGTGRLQLHRREEQPQVHRDRERAVAEPAGPGRSEQAGAQLLGVRPAAPHRRRRHVHQDRGRRACARIGLFVEVAEGNRFAGAGGNRYSFIYSGDVNGDGAAGNDLIYIPRDQSEIVFAIAPPAAARTSPRSSSGTPSTRSSSRTTISAPTAARSPSGSAR